MKEKYQTDPTDFRRTIWEHQQQFYDDKIDEMDKLIKKQNLPKPTQDETENELPYNY